MTGTPAVRNLHALEASRDGYTSTRHTEAGGTTGTPAVVTYMLVKQAAQIHISYGCCTHTTTEVSYIGMTVCRPGNYKYIRRYDYKGRRHYQITFGAMPTISRS